MPLPLGGPGTPIWKGRVHLYCPRPSLNTKRSWYKDSSSSLSCSQIGLQHTDCGTIPEDTMSLNLCVIQAINSVVSFLKCGTKPRVSYISITSILVAIQWVLMLERVKLLHFWSSKNKDPSRKCLNSWEWNKNPQMICFGCFRISPVILCTVTVKARALSKLSNCNLSWEVPWDSQSLKTWFWFRIIGNK